MLIGLCGALCSGKHEVAKYLVSQHGFTILSLSRAPTYQLEAGVSTVQITQSEEPLDVREKSSSSPAVVPEHVFPDANSLLEFVTKRWRELYVMTDIWDETVLDILVQRPLFMLVSVDAPVLVRWQRHVSRCALTSTPPMTLESFLTTSDTHLYHPTLGLSPVLHRATLHLLNPSSSLAVLHRTLSTLNLPSPDRLRPTWDAYFMHLSSLAARRSNCMKRRVGCVLVRSKRVISTGYNGTPRGLLNCNEGGCGRCNAGAAGGMGLDACLCMHAEENALLEAGRERVGGGAVLYCDTCPCLTCAIKIVQVGVVEVVYGVGYSMDRETARVLEEGGVKLRQYAPPREGLVYLDEVHLEGGSA